MRFAFHVLILLSLGCSSTHGTTDADAGPSEPDAARPPADAGRRPDAAAPIADAGADAAIQLDAALSDAGEAMPGEIACGDTPCMLADQACRRTCLVDGMESPVCVDAPEGWEIGECPTAEETFPIVVARCDGPEDCSDDDACLILRGSLGSYPQCGCDSTPEAGCAELWSGVLCHTDGDCPSPFTRCEASEELLGFYRTCVE